MQVDYVKALDTGHLYQLSLHPGSCDLSQLIVQQNLATTIQTRKNLPPFSFQVYKTGLGLYTMNLTLTDNLLQKTSLDLTLYNLKATSYVPKTFIPSPVLLIVAQYTIGAKLAVSGYLAGTFPGTVLLHMTSALWSLVSFQQFVSYFVFINIEFPFQVKLFFSFTQPQVWDFMPNPLSSLTKKLAQDSPGFIDDRLQERARPAEVH